MTQAIPPILTRAFWIWPELECHDIHNGYACFRKAFDLASVPKKALACLTADMSYRLRVNGQNVCRGPARGYQVSWPYDTIDLAPFLRKGSNLITVRAYNPGRSTFSYRTEGHAGFLFAARMGTVTVLSDGSWRCRRQPGTRRDTPPHSLQLPSHQEWIDLSADPADWEDPGYDDSGWLSSERLRRWDFPPYKNLEDRGLPMMWERVERPRLIGEGGGKSLADWRGHRDLAPLRYAEPINHQPVQSKAAKVQVPATPKGRFRSYLFDFGRVQVGSLRLTVGGAAGGETIDCLHTEVLHPDRLAPKMVAYDHSRTHLANRLICRAGTQSHAFYQQLGFRYLTVTVRENKQPLEIKVELETCGYPLDGSGSFESSDPELNAIWKASAHTQQICSLDAYVDTPWREQAQWWGDARIQAWNTFHLCADVRLLRRGIRILAGQPSPDGITYGHAPTMAHSCVLPDFAIIWILTLWDDYWQTGTTDMIEAHADRVQSILGYFREHTNPKTGLIDYDPRYWLFLDWTDLQKDGQPALLSLWLLHCLQKLEILLAESSLKKNFCDVPKMRVAIEKAITGHLLCKDGLVCDGLTERGKASKKTSLQAQTLAWMCDLPGFNREKALESILLPWVREDRISHAAPSAYWCAYPLDLLAREGYGAEVVAFYKRRWKVMADFGSCYEDFIPHQPGHDMMSHSHAWSAHPVYMLMRILGGVRQAAPAWRKISFNPVPAADRVSVCIPTPQGDIRVHGETGEDGQPIYDLNLPKKIKCLKK